MKLRGQAAVVIAGFRRWDAGTALFHSRLGKPEGFAQFPASIIANTRFDGAPRRAPH